MSILSQYNEYGVNSDILNKCEGGQIKCKNRWMLE